jgi:transcriptional regulator with XRE-family HTH domain
MTDAKPKKGGRSDSYRPEYAEIVRKLALLGWTDQQIAKHLGVSRTTLWSWQKTHEDLYEALSRAKDLADAEVLNALYQSAIGFETVEERLVKKGDTQVVVKLKTKHPPNTMAGMYWLNNRQRQRFSRNPDPIQDDTIPEAVKVSVNVVDASKPDEQ